MHHNENVSIFITTTEHNSNCLRLTSSTVKETFYSHNNIKWIRHFQLVWKRKILLTNWKRYQRKWRTVLSYQLHDVTMNLKKIVFFYFSNEVSLWRKKRTTKRQPKRVKFKHQIKMIHHACGSLASIVFILLEHFLSFNFFSRFL